MGSSVVSELLSGLFELREISFKAEVHHARGQKNHTYVTLYEEVGYRKPMNRKPTTSENLESKIKQIFF